MTSPSESHSVMDSLLKTSQIDWNEFLESIWETKCHRFAFDEQTPSGKPSSTASATTSETTTPSRSGNLWSRTIYSGWDILTHMMDNTHPIRKDNNNNNTGGQVVPPPLLFRDLQPMDDPEEIRQLYGNSLYASYLAGTSVVWNHADQISPEVAALCEDLQRDNKFPHAYANAYLTPPQSQTVPAHADDRDVLVFQLRGRKHWKVYKNVPVPHPYPHEQVGKSGIAVPESVLNGPLAFDSCLSPGDVLYLPRGMVHEASTVDLDGPPDLSFHITVALATHDWTLAGNLGRILQTKLLEMKPKPNGGDAAIAAKNDSLRRSLLPTAIGSYSQQTEEEGGRKNLVCCGGSLVDANALQAQLDNIFETLRSKITAQSILEDMNQRIETHNIRASKKRRDLVASTTKQQMALPQTAYFGERENNNSAAVMMDRVVGPIAAKSITLETLLRVSTPIEKEHAQESRNANDGASPAGLTVRDGVGDDVASVVGAIKGGQITTVRDFRSLCYYKGALKQQSSSLCDLTALSLAKRAVELGAFAIVLARRNDEAANGKKESSSSGDAVRSSKRQRTKPM
jgi:hypothetical protein